jgi:hypothetical protein
LQVLRRKTTKFLRILTKKLLAAQNLASLTWPKKAMNITTKDTKNEGNLQMNGQPMKIVVYSRGNSGKGRTMANEQLLVAALQSKGADAFLCCDFSTTTLHQQLYYAYNADVVSPPHILFSMDFIFILSTVLISQIMGLHGAAITHGIFMRKGGISIEFKTLYAYDSILFGLIADSRYGIHGQLDIRKYFVPGGHRPMDQNLIDRAMLILQKALSLQRKSFLEIESPVVQNTSDLSIQEHLCKLQSVDPIQTVAGSQFPGDFLVRPVCIKEEVNHFLGPFQKDQTKVCESLIFHQYRAALGKKDHSFHCDICTNYVV